MLFLNVSWNKKNETKRGKNWNKNANNEANER